MEGISAINERALMPSVLSSQSIITVSSVTPVTFDNAPSSNNEILWYQQYLLPLQANC